MVEKTNIMAYFSVSGDNFNPNDITKELNLPPDEYWIKGDSVKGRHPNVKRRQTNWSICTEYEESLDINE